MDQPANMRSQTEEEAKKDALQRRSSRARCATRKWRNMLPAVRLACAALLVSMSAAASAVVVDGVVLPEHVQIGAGGPELVLNGAGVRVDMIFKVYVAALYLPSRMDDGGAILRDNRPSRLSLHLLRDVTPHQLAAVLNDALRATLTPEQRLPLEPRLKQLEAIIHTLQQLKKGMQIVLDYRPHLDTTIRVDDEEKGRIPGADFNHALLSLWIGDRPRDPLMRRALLGIR